MANSQCPLSEKLMGINIKALGLQVGINNTGDLKKLRSSLLKLELLVKTTSTSLFVF